EECGAGAKAIEVGIQAEVEDLPDMAAHGRHLGLNEHLDAGLTGELAHVDVVGGRGDREDGGKRAVQQKPQALGCELPPGRTGSRSAGAIALAELPAVEGFDRAQVLELGRADLQPHRFSPSRESTYRCQRRSEVSSGWKARATRFPWRRATGSEPSSASTSTLSPCVVTRGALINTAGPGPPSKGTSTVASKLSTCLPYALRRTVMSIISSGCWSGRPSSTRLAIRIIPAQVPRTGIPAWARRRMAASRAGSISRIMVVLSPPGRIKPSTASSSLASRTGTPSTSQARRAARCSRKSPCS